MVGSYNEEVLKWRRYYESSTGHRRADDAMKCESCNESWPCNFGLFIEEMSVLRADVEALRRAVDANATAHGETLTW